METPKNGGDFQDEVRIGDKEGDHEEVQKLRLDDSDAPKFSRRNFGGILIRGLWFGGSCYLYVGYDVKPAIANDCTGLNGNLCSTLNPSNSCTSGNSCTDGGNRCSGYGVSNTCSAGNDCNGASGNTCEGGANNVCTAANSCPGGGNDCTDAGTNNSCTGGYNVCKGSTGNTCDEGKSNKPQNNCSASANNTCQVAMGGGSGNVCGF